MCIYFVHMQMFQYKRQKKVPSAERVTVLLGIQIPTKNLFSWQHMSLCLWHLIFNIMVFAEEYCLITCSKSFECPLQQKFTSTDRQNVSQNDLYVEMHYLMKFGIAITAVSTNLLASINASERSSFTIALTSR